MTKLFLILFTLLMSVSSFAQIEFKDIAVGYGYACGHNSSQISCWGENRYGRVAQLDGFSNIRNVQTEGEYACALDDFGIMCWGDAPALLPEMISNDVSSFKIAGDNICALIKGRLTCMDQKILLNMPQTLDHISSFDFYRNSSDRNLASGICAIQDGQAFCWNHVGDKIQIPGGLGKIKKFQLESNKGCSFSESNILTCWDSGPKPHKYDMSVPEHSGTIVDYFFGGDGGCLNNTSGDLICWGLVSYYKPPVLPEGFKVDRLVGGSTRFSGPTYCAFDKLQKSYCWGADNYILKLKPFSVKGYNWFQADLYSVCFDLAGELKCTRPNVPIAGVKVSNLKMISSEDELTCFLDDLGVRCINKEGLLYSAPSDVKKAVSLVMQGDGHKNQVCAVLQSGDVKCWGENNSRGIETPKDLKNIKKMSSGNYHTCVLSHDGVSDCWGDDLPRFKEKAVKDVSVGLSHWCLLFESDEIRCKELDQPAPQHLFNVKGLISGWKFSCAYSDTEISCWGENRNEFGLSSHIRSTPKPVGKIRNVSAGFAHACFEDDEKIKCWGFNIDGEYNFYQ